MNRGVAIPNKRIITSSAKRQDTPAARPPTAHALRRSAARVATDSRGATAASAAEPGGETSGADTGLSARVATAADLPWLQTWAAQLGLPAPRSRRVRSFVLLKDGQRVGYMAARDEMADAGRARESMLWIVSAFLIPTLRGQGMILKFGEILSRVHYRKGKVGCRVAADNTPMMRLMARGGWKKLHSTRRFTDFMLELDAPFRASRKG